MQTKKHEKIFNILYQVALTHESPSRHIRLPVVAAITHKREIISIGVSRKKTHPLQRRHQTYVGRDRLHAEIDAIQRAIRQNADLTRCNIYVLRVKQHVIHDQIITGYGLAKPCGAEYTPLSGCASAISIFGIQRTYYTIDSPTLKWEEANF